MNNNLLQKYTIDDLYPNPVLTALDEPAPSFNSAWGDGVSPSQLTAGELIGNTTVQDGYLQSSNFVTGSTGWQLTPTSGEFNFGVSVSSLTGGTITSESIVLAADGSGDATIRAGKTDFTNTETGFILGIDDSDSDTPKFYIGDATQYFNWTGSNVAVKGAITIDSGSGIANLSDAGALATLSSVTPTYANIALQGWQFTSVFSSTDYNTVAWSSGTFTTAAGTSYSITGSNTGNMAATTYIYLDIGTSTTDLQTSTTASNAVGSGKVLIAVASANADTTSDAQVQVFGGTGGQILNVDNLAANSASTNEFISNTAQIANLVVTNAKINDLAVDKLTAGTITSKSINLAISAGTGDVEIRSGIASGDFANAGNANGFIIGLDDSDSDKAKFYFGSSSNYVKYDGTTTTFKGAVTIDSGSGIANLSDAGALATADTVDSSVVSGIALLELSHNLVFSSTDSDTVSWASGTITMSDGTSYSISSGNTGNMIQRTYIYLSPSDSTTVLQTTTTFSTAVGNNKKLIAIAEDATDGAIFQVQGGYGGVTLTPDAVITANLSAISADLGTITAGTVTGATIQTASSGTRFVMTSTSFQGINSGGDIIFEVIISGGNAGDVILGDDASGNYAIWDNSNTSFDIYKGGNLLTKFGGDGSDGALSISSGTTTIDLSGETLVVKNYTSISITGTGKLAFSNPASTGTAVILRSQGNVTLTSSTSPCIDGTNIGAAGGTAVLNDTGNDGTDGRLFIGTPATGGTSGTKFSTDTSLGQGGTGGSASTSNIDDDIISVSQIVPWYIGAGGGAGGGGSNNSTAGDGGRGGGLIKIECGGALNFTGTISVAGSAGTDATPGTPEPNQGAGGGGGGGGGTVIIIYNSLTADSGTLTVSGGAGGAGDTSLSSNDSSSRGGGGGGGGGSKTAGSTGSSSNGRYGANGATGGTGFSFIGSNINFV